MHSPEKIRNIAVIAHIDHGKTTLVNELLVQSNIFRENQVVPERAMDSYDQEQERGITIFAKPTAIYYGEYKLNLIDTPGHADFSGEVERILGMVNSVLLIIDAQDGPMPQTRFVLSKSLKMGLRPIVVFNKIDRPHAEPDRVLNETFDLFVELGATNEQLDFRFCYASAIAGYAMLELHQERVNMNPLLDLIVAATPAPSGKLENPLLIQASSIAYDDYLGRLLYGRMLEGRVKKGQVVTHINAAGVQSRAVITKVQGFLGLERVELEEAGAGDVVQLAGIEDISIGDTLCDPLKIIQLPPIKLEEPTISIEMIVNDGPFVGRSGKHVTMNKIRERLEKEKRANISYIITESDDGRITIAGRGELHLSIVLEAMRRENFEFCLSKPQVILKIVDGVKYEPISRVHIELPEEFAGGVIEHLAKRKGEMQNLHVDEQKITHFEFLIPTRGIMGYRSDFLTATRGLGIMTYHFDSYHPWKGDIPGRANGVLISINVGKVTAYSSFSIEDRGRLFTAPGDEVYEGMIVGENSRDNDMIVNLTKGKQLTNVRAAGSDENIILKPPKKFSLEEAICYIENDELIEVTPDYIRLRKRYLNETDRKRNKQ
ncbi:MAG: translational GTPase TypA [Simkaniaceae bacterium]|nr:translational GTPase TypA [Simkaniaceae bacterium]